MFYQTGNKVIHKRIDSCIISSCCQYQLTVAECIAECLRHIISCQIINNYFRTSLALDVEENWDDEARRYFIGIVGKYGAQVQRLLKVAATLDIQIICPLHGPVLTENLGHYISLYDTWSSYTPEEEGIVVAYTSVYGHTKEAVNQFVEKLKSTELTKSIC